jgi:hypothetical protein
MTQAKELLNGLQEGAMNSVSAPAPDDQPPELDIPPQCSLQWDALMAASEGLDAAALLLEERAIAMRNCVLGLNPDVQPWPPAAPGGEYVSVGSAPVSLASAASYRQRQIDQSIQAISAERRRLKDLLRTA